MDEFNQNGQEAQVSVPAKTGGSKKIIIAVMALALVGAGVYFFMMPAAKAPEVTPTPPAPKTPSVPAAPAPAKDTDREKFIQDSMSQGFTRAEAEQFYEQVVKPLNDADSKTVFPK